MTDFLKAEIEMECAGILDYTYKVCLYINLNKKLWRCNEHRQ